MTVEDFVSKNVADPSVGNFHFLSLNFITEWGNGGVHNEELNDLYPSPNIVRVIKLRKMRWTGHVARMGEERGCIGSWWGKRRDRDH